MSADETAAVVDPSYWTFEDGGVTYPFVEDENANITGLGWQDYAEFAEAVNRWDRSCMGDSWDDGDKWIADDICHRWAVLDPDGERLWSKIDGQPVGPETPNAIKITTLWGQR